MAVSRGCNLILSQPLTYIYQEHRLNYVPMYFHRILIQSIPLSCSFINMPNLMLVNAFSDYINGPFLTKIS